MYKFDYASKRAIAELDARWQIMSICILFNTIYIGMLLSVFKDNLSCWKDDSCLGIILFSVGFISLIFWLGTYKRNEEYFRFRVYQINKYAEDEDFTKEEKSFSDGGVIYDGNKLIKHSCISMSMKKQRFGYWIIGLFAFSYLLIIVNLLVPFFVSN